jgi:hypothetical protein
MAGNREESGRPDPANLGKGLFASPAKTRFRGNAVYGEPTQKRKGSVSAI